MVTLFIFSSTSLSFLPSTTACSVFFIASCHLTEAPWERLWHKRHILFFIFLFSWLLVFNFLLESSLGWHWFLVALETPWRDSLSLSPAMRLESYCARDRNWHLCVTVRHVPNAGGFSQWQPMGHAAVRLFTGEGPIVCKPACLAYHSLKMSFTVF